MLLLSNTIKSSLEQYSEITVSYVIQQITTNAAHESVYFNINGEHYLYVNNSLDDTTSNIDSYVYKWDGLELIQYQTIPTKQGAGADFFTIGNDSYLLIGHHSDLGNHNTPSKIYKWDGSQFVWFQDLPTVGASCCLHMVIEDQHYVIVTCYRTDSSKASTSKLFKWNGSQFTSYQDFQTYGGNTNTFFEMNGDCYLFLGNMEDDSSTDVTSYLYKWNGSQFSTYQSFNTHTCFGAVYFTQGDDNYFVIGNVSGNITMYKYYNNTFNEVQTLDAGGVLSINKIGGDLLLHVTNSTYTNIIIYRFVNGTLIKFKKISLNNTECRNITYLPIHEKTSTFFLCGWIDTAASSWNTISTLNCWHTN